MPSFTFVMMRQFCAILIFLIYSLSTTGVNATQMFCCGQLRSSEITIIPEINGHKHTCKETTQHKDCCKTEIHYLKVNDSHVYSTVAGLQYSPVAVLPEIWAHVELFPVDIDTYKPDNLHSPPRNCSTAIYKLNCVYRI